MRLGQEQLAVAHRQPVMRHDPEPKDLCWQRLQALLLQEGHVFGRKVVAIPIGAVTAVNQNRIQLNITTQQ